MAGRAIARVWLSEERVTTHLVQKRSMKKGDERVEQDAGKLKAQFWEPWMILRVERVVGVNVKVKIHDK